MSFFTNISISRFLAFVSGPAFFILLYLLNPLNLDIQAARVLAIGAWLIIWWLTEVVPMAVTSLLPIVLFPMLGVMKLGEASAPYGNPVVFLFMGGFMIGLAIEKCQLHRRIALNIVSFTGTSPNRIILGFMLATHLISMWLSNTATTVMMLPIASSVVSLMQENYTGNGKPRNFYLSLMVGIAYAASIGGISTLIGTPPNVVMSGYFYETFGTEISFMGWMLFVAPLAFVMLLFCYIVLVYVLFPNKMEADGMLRDIVRTQTQALGRISTDESRVLVIFIMTAGLWMFRVLINKVIHPVTLDDTGIALIGTLALFLTPSGSKKGKFLLEWPDTKKMAWGILLLFGAGLTLANAMENVGLIELIGVSLAEAGQGDYVLLMIMLTVSALFLSEVMSNVAQVTVFVPMVCGIAKAAGIDPLYFAFPVTLAASTAFMLPMGTPPNAIVFASGHIRMQEMARAGFLMNIFCSLVICLMMLLFKDQIFAVLRE